MVRINWTPQASDDLKGIADYISRDSVKYAKLQVYRIIQRTQILKSYSRAGNVTPELNNPIIRELMEGNYRIIYKLVSENQVDIITIHHSARDLGRRNL
jgi:toxin ParE1/3/4